MTVEVPSDSARTRRIVLAVLGGVLGVALLAFGVWAATHPANQGAKQTEIEPAEPTAEPTASVLPSSPVDGGGETTASAVSTSAGDGAPIEPAPASPAASARIAFVLGGRIYVAEQDGSGAVSVAPQASVYSLSPDGGTLAVIYDVSEGAAQPGTVSLFDTTTGAMRSVGSGAVALSPTWAPDSGWLAYTSGDGALSVHRVAASGGAPASVANPGAQPSVSRDGSLVAYGESDQLGAGGALHVAPVAGGEAVAVRGGGSALSWGWGPSNALFFTRPGEAEGAWELWRAGAPAFRGKRVGSIALEPPAFALVDVTVSPDGAAVLMAAMGDDAYSRLWTADAKTGRFSALPTRRDAYPYGWSTDGRVLYFEGNSYQGEASALASILPDGTSKQLVVTGAQR